MTDKHDDLKDLLLNELDQVFGDDSRVRYTVLTPQDQMDEQPDMKTFLPLGVLARIEKRVDGQRHGLNIYLDPRQVYGTYAGAERIVAMEVQRMARALSSHISAYKEAQPA